MDIWVKFLEDKILKTKSADGELEDKGFKVGDVVQFEKAKADMLVELGVVEETEEPKAADLDTITKNLEERMESLVESSIGAALDKVSEKLEKNAPNFAQPKGPNADFEANYGFKDENHFFHCVKAVGAGSNDFPGVEFLTKAPTGQNISSDGEGNFLVPEPMLNRMWTNIQEEPTSLLGRSLQFTTGATSLKVPRIFEPSRKEGTGQRNAGIQAYWEDEADEHTASKMTTGKEQLELHKLSVLTYATEEMLSDSGSNIGPMMSGRAQNAINFKINDAIVHGSGVGKPKGILRGDSIITVPLEGAQGNFSIFHKNVSNMYWRNLNRSSAIWLVHTDLAQQLEFMYFNDDATNQRPVYLPANQVVGSPFGLLYGRPVIPFEFMNGFGDKGDILFVDMSQYATLTKAGAGVQSASSIHVRFLYDEVAFKWTFRVDGRELWTSPVEDLKGDTTRSWAVTLAARNAGGTSSGI